MRRRSRERKMTEEQGRDEGTRMVGEKEGSEKTKKKNRRTEEERGKKAMKKAKG